MCARSPLAQRHRHGCNSSSPDCPDSPARHQRKQQQNTASPIQRTPLRQDSGGAPARAAAAARPGSSGSANASSSEQLQDALWYLLDRTEQLSAENGVLKTQLLGQGSPCSKVASGSLNDPVQQHRSKQCHSSLRHNNVSPYTRLHSSSSPNFDMAVNSQHKTATAIEHANDAGCDEAGQFDDTSSVLTGSTQTGDDLSVAASDELAAAEAVAAAECSRRRRQARAAVGAMRHGSSPGKNTLARSSSQDSRDLQTDTTSCGTPTSGQAAASAGRATVVHCAASQAGLKSSSSSSRQLLETVLVSYPNNRLGKVMKELVATVENSGIAAAAVSSMAAAGRGPGYRVRSAGMTRNSSAAGADVGGNNAALAREQLQRLAQLSPARQRLLRALAAAE